MKAAWKEVRLGEIADVQSGGTPLISNKQLWDGGVPWYSSGELNNTFTSDPERTVSAAGLEKSNAKLFPAGSLLIGMYDTAAMKMSILDRAAAFNQAIAGVKPNDQIDICFVFYALNSIKEELLGRRRGVRQKNLSLGKVRDFEVPVPPLPEQQRIVTLLDEAFDGIATAKANAEKNLQNAHAIFEGHVQSVLTKRGENWADRTLDQVCVVERGSSPRPIKEFFTTADDGVNWIKISDTEEGGKYVYSTAQKITAAGAKQSRFVKEGDFILTNSMSYGRPYIMKTNGYIHDGWFVLRLNAVIDSDYFYYLLSSNLVQLQFMQLASGSVVKNISGDLVKRVVLPIPPLAQQQAIVEKLLAVSKATQRLESIYQQKLAAIAELKKSLLHQAFSGQL